MRTCDFAVLANSSNIFSVLMLISTCLGTTFFATGAQIQQSSTLLSYAPHHPQYITILLFYKIQQEQNLSQDSSFYGGVFQHCSTILFDDTLLVLQSIDQSINQSIKVYNNNTFFTLYPLNCDSDSVLEYFYFFYNYTIFFFHNMVYIFIRIMFSTSVFLLTIISVSLYQIHIAMHV